MGHVQAAHTSQSAHTRTPRARHPVIPRLPPIGRYFGKQEIVINGIQIGPSVRCTPSHLGRRPPHASPRRATMKLPHSPQLGSRCAVKSIAPLFTTRKISRLQRRILACRLRAAAARPVGVHDWASTQRKRSIAETFRLRSVASYRAPSSSAGPSARHCADRRTDGAQTASKPASRA